MRRFFILLTAILLGSCNPGGNKKIKPKKEITVLNKTFTTSIGIYFLDKDSISITRFNTEAKKILPEFNLAVSVTDSINKDIYFIKYIKDPLRDFIPPDTGYLQYSGANLTTEEKLKLQSARGALSIIFQGLQENVIEKEKRISELISSVSEGRHVIITDYNTIECFNTISWKANRVSNFNSSHEDLTSQIVIHLYREDEFCRAVTLGMDKFCLPDISIKDISCRDQNSFASLINAVVQTLFEHQAINEDSSLFVDLQKIKNDKVRSKLMANLKTNSKKSAEINLRSVVPEEGDNINKQFLIVFKNAAYTSPQEEQTAILDDLFGSEESVVHTKHDPELLAASERAKLKLPGLKARFNAGLEPGFSLLVKAPFRTDNGGREWMWVEITKWENKSITGILQNEPSEIAKLKAGAIVKANEDEVFDYVLYKPDGTYEGNETEKVLDKRK